MPARRYPQLFDPEWLAANVHRASSDIAREVGCVPSLIAVAYRRAGIERADRSYRNLYPQLQEPTALAGRTVAEVMAATGATEGTVRLAFRRAGLSPRRQTRPSRWPELDDRAWLLHRRRWALGLIADDLGCSESRVALAFNTHHIDRNEP